MDMKVDSSYVKAQREQRAWSQEHLAEVTGLGLRTIQRIESAGTASYESARSLAAVFGVDVADLRDPREPAGGPRISVPLRPLLGVLAALVTGVALLVATRSFADQVLIDLGVRRDMTLPGSDAIDTSQRYTQFIVDEGTLLPDVNALRFEELRLTIVPKLLPDGEILIEMQVFEQKGDVELLVSAPRLIVHDGEKAEVVTGDAARSFHFSITPRRRTGLF